MKPAPGRDRTDLWAFTGLGLYLGIGYGSIFPTAIVADPVLNALGLQVDSGTIGLSIRNALQPIVWGLAVALLSMPLGRRLVPGIRFPAAGWVVLGIGLVLASLTWLLIEEFVRARFGYLDMRFVGFSLFAWPAIVAVALTGWAALAVPARSPMPVLVVLAAASLGVALVPSVAGAADGIDPENLPLAAALVVDVLYAAAVVTVAMRRARRAPSVTAAGS